MRVCVCVRNDMTPSLDTDPHRGMDSGVKLRHCVHALPYQSEICQLYAKKRKAEKLFHLCAFNVYAQCTLTE